ncbi:protein kinase, putative [Leishmania tarentolae]|uniref:non-specific serine/threonine protein kinase n=1 Tax=Leishmania tarentolae TaxID=5689 RepID=A0A640KJT8_LEITA|nr:protein kinase, putative [Leishmania tarentolae]
MNNYVLNDEIGQGAFSTIYKGRYRTTTEFYAIASIDKKRRERVVNCVQLLRSMHHSNIIEFHNWYETNNHLWIITEYCTGGDVSTILRSNINLTIQAVQAFGRDVAMGLMYIHSKGVLYNDLQTRNLLMDSAAMLRFHDFSLACLFNDAATRPFVGTPLYMAPELFMADCPIYSMASDLWSFGCVLHELATGKPPFAESDLDTLLTSILSSPTPTVPDAPESFQTLLCGLLEKDPLKRYTWDDVVRSEFWDEPLLLPNKGFPSQLVWEDYKRSRSGRAEIPYNWTDASVRAAVARAVAAAKSNASAHNVEERERAAATLNVSKELDFTASAEMAVEQLPEQIQERDTNTADYPPTSHGSLTHGCPSTVSAASNIVKANGSPSSAFASSHRSRLSESKNSAGDPQRRRASKGRGTVSSHASRSASIAYESGRATYAANCGAKEDRSMETNLHLFASDALRHFSISDLLPHHTDQHIRPLSNNSRIEYTPEPSYNIAALSFRALTAAEINSLTGKEHTAFFRSLYLSLSNTSSGYDNVLNTMNYVISLCGDAEVARASVNSSVMRLCVKHAGRKDAPACFRAAAALIMGLLVRTTAFITSEVASSSILPDIMQLFEDESDVRVKRKLIACIGEFLFYIAVQQKKQRAIWKVQPTVVKRIYASALDSDDDVLKHYAAKMIENMASTPQKEMTLELFAEPSFVEKLLAVFALPPVEGRSEDMRSDAACAAFKVAMMKDELILVAMQSKWLRVTSYATVMQRSTVTHTMQILLTFLNHAIVKGLVTLQNPFAQLWVQVSLESHSTGSSSSSGRRSSVFTSSLSIEDAEEVVGNVLFVSEDLLVHLSEAIEQASVAVYGKTLLFVMLIGCVGGRTICQILNSRIVSFLGRLLRDADSYVKRCGTALLAFFGWFVSEKLASIGRRVSSTLTPTHLAAMQQLLNNSAVRSRIDFQKDVFQSLSTCIDKAMSSTIYSTYRDEFNNIADRFVEKPEEVLRYEENVCLYLATSYAEMLRRKETSSRFTAIRFLTSVMVPISAEVTATQKESTSATSAARQVLNAVTPNAASLLQETSPIPTNTMRLLVTCGEMAQSKLSGLVSEELLGQIMNYVNGSEDDDDLYYPLSFIHLCLLVCQRVDIFNCVVRQGLCTLVLETLASAVRIKNEPLVEMCCNLLAVVARRVAVDSSSRVAVQCASCVQEDSISSVLLPICVDTSNSIAVMESASSVIEDFTRLSSVARSDLTSASAIAMLTEALSNALLSSARRAVALSLLAALAMSCESSPRRVLQELQCDSRFMSVLANAADCTHMRLVAGEANKILKKLS